MRRNSTALIAVFTLTCGFTLLGCSSNDGSEVVAPPQTTPPMSKAEFVLDANTICADAETEIVGLQTGDSGSNTGAPVTGDERSALVGQITPIAQRAIDELRALTPPPEDADLVTAGIDDMQRTLDEAQTNATAIIDPIGISGPELNAYGLASCFSAGPALDATTTTP